MKREVLVNIIKRKIALEHRTQKEAAKAIGINHTYMSRILGETEGELPRALVEWAGYTVKRLEPEYMRVIK